MERRWTACTAGPLRWSPSPASLEQMAPTSGTGDEGLRMARARKHLASLRTCTYQEHTGGLERVAGPGLRCEQRKPRWDDEAESTKEACRPGVGAGDVRLLLCIVPCPALRGTSAKAPGQGAELNSPKSLHADG